jgi:D-sedoheptulose 7-phosphate isomerase
MFMDKHSFIDQYLKRTAQIANECSRERLEKMADILSITRELKGRVFFLGIGGGAASASHATNDFNKIAKISTFCLTDNVGLFSALANDEGWDSVFKRQLEMHNLTAKDCLFIFSVNGGTQNISGNLVKAMEYAKVVGARILAVVGRETGVAAQVADACLVVPKIEESMVTPHTEDYQLVVNHLLINLLKQNGGY